MLWNIIRDFIVEHITGGYNSSGKLIFTHIGQVITLSGGEEEANILGSLNDIISPVGSIEGAQYTLGFADWLATTLTVICMCLIVAFAIWLVRWVFKAVSSAFLLKR